MLKVPEGRFSFRDYSDETRTLGFMVGFDLTGVLKLKLFYNSTHSKA